MQYGVRSRAVGLALGLSALGLGCGGSSASPTSPSAADGAGGSGGVVATGGSGAQVGPAGTGTGGGGTPGAAGIGGTAGIGGSAGIGGTAGGGGSAGSGGAAGAGGSAGAGGTAGTGGGTGGNAGSHGGTGGNTGSGTGGTGAGNGGAATFTAVYAILMSNCAGSDCHVGAAFFPAGGLSFADKMTAYSNLVDAPARNCQGESRVTAGMPDASEIVQALEHKSGCAPAMPRGKPALSMSDINTIIAWIMAGAKND